MTHPERAPTAQALDETRRLLYMTLAAAHTDRYEIVGTLVNALAHHHHLITDTDAAMRHLITVTNGGTASGSGDSIQWVRDLLDELTESLNGASADALQSD